VCHEEKSNGLKKLKKIFQTSSYDSSRSDSKKAFETDRHNHRISSRHSIVQNAPMPDGYWHPEDRRVALRLMQELLMKGIITNTA